MTQAPEGATRLCVQCKELPCLGVLTRCVRCVKAGADADRVVRTAAEVRVDTRKREARSARLEQQADAILDRDSQLVQQLGQHAEALQACYRELLQPRNDPQYLQALEGHEADREALANVTSAVHHVVEGGKSWLSISLTNPRNHAIASEAARKLGRHLEARVYRHEDPKEVQLADRKQAQPPKHAFGRTARSLGNRGR
jgi:hypothetical protein